MAEAERDFSYPTLLYYDKILYCGPVMRQPVAIYSGGQG